MTSHKQQAMEYIHVLNLTSKDKVNNTEVSYINTLLCIGDFNILCKDLMILSSTETSLRRVSKLTLQNLSKTYVISIVRDMSFTSITKTIVRIQCRPYIMKSNLIHKVLQPYSSLISTCITILSALFEIQYKITKLM